MKVDSNAEHCIYNNQFFRTINSLLRILVDLGFILVLKKLLQIFFTLPLGIEIIFLIIP